MSLVVVLIAVAIAAIAYYFFYAPSSSSSQDENGRPRAMKAAERIVETEDKGGVTFGRSLCLKTAEPVVEPRQQEAALHTFRLKTAEATVDNQHSQPYVLKTAEMLPESGFPQSRRLKTAEAVVEGGSSRSRKLKTAEALRESDGTGRTFQPSDLKTAELLRESASDQSRQLRTAEALVEMKLQPRGLRTAEALAETGPQPRGLRTAEALAETKPQLRGLRTAEALAETKPQPRGLRTAEALAETGPQLRGLRTAEALAETKPQLRGLRTAEALAETKPQLRGLRTAEALAETGSQLRELRTAEALAETKPQLRGLRTAEALAETGSQPRGLRTAEALAETGSQPRGLRTAEALAETGPQLRGLRTAEALAETKSQPRGLRTAEALAETVPQPRGLKTAEALAERGPQPRGLRTAEALAETGPQPRGLKTAEALAETGPQPRGLRTAEALAEMGPQPRGLRTAEALVESVVSPSRGLKTAGAGAEEKLQGLKTAELLLEKGTAQSHGLRTAEALAESSGKENRSQPVGLKTAEAVVSGNGDDREPDFAPTQASGEPLMMATANQPIGGENTSSGRKKRKKKSKKNRGSRSHSHGKHRKRKSKKKHSKKERSETSDRLGSELNLLTARATTDSSMIAQNSGSVANTNANRRIRRLSEEEYKELERTCGRHVQSVKKRAAQEWPEPAVSEGIPANKDEFPWALKMATLVGNYGSEMCTAQVISKWHVVAAAHCLEFTNKRDPPKSRRLRVKSFVITESSVHYVIHGMCGEKAAASLPHSDLVILELESPLNISDPSIRPICLASPLQEIPHQNRIYGFGATESAEKNHAENIELHWLFDGEVMSEEQCQGDSGGGLSAVVNKRHTLFGILSKSYGYCSHLDEPWREFFELASKVSAFHDFFCYHTGICSLGYDVYLDFTYPFDPERYVVVEKGLGDSSLLNGAPLCLKELESSAKRKHPPLAQVPPCYGNLGFAEGKANGSNQPDSNQRPKDFRHDATVLRSTS
ncbi:unnamed protein product [Toxocara canis]|uniref:Peptidase S1 domain-containing protein n=1 Tax=Toxocara canis TaxID=6265 RepID=A0A183UGQ7_TOXCA|nr:unnamed protein product [Toxocara canis]